MSTPQPTLYEAAKHLVDDVGDYVTESMGLEPTPHAGRDPIEVDENCTSIQESSTDCAPVAQFESTANTPAEKVEEIEQVAASGPKHTTNEVEDPNAKNHTV